MCVTILANILPHMFLLLNYQQQQKRVKCFYLASNIHPKSNRLTIPSKMVQTNMNGFSFGNLELAYGVVDSLRTMKATG